MNPDTPCCPVDKNLKQFVDNDQNYLVKVLYFLDKSKINLL